VNNYYIAAIWLALAPLVFAVVTVVTLVLLPRTLRFVIARFGHRVSEPEVKFLFVVLLGLGGLATAAGSEALAGEDASIIHRRARLAAGDDGRATPTSRLSSMFPLSFRRFRYALPMLGAATLASVAAAAVAGAATPPTAASVISATKTAVSKVSGVHIVDLSTSDKTTSTVVVDLGKTNGVEQITTGKGHVTITVTAKDAYVQGNSTGMTKIMGLTAAQEKTVGLKAVEMKAGSTPYDSFKASLTTSALASFLPVAKGTTLLPLVSGSGHYVLKWSTKATSTTPAVVSELIISSASDSLPETETVTATTGGGKTTFSKWGETVNPSVPSGSSIVAYAKVFG
jgi:hypothetical protein